MLCPARISTLSRTRLWSNFPFPRKSERLRSVASTSTNRGCAELFGATDFRFVRLGDLRANGLGGAFDGFGGDCPAPRVVSSARSRKRTASHCPPRLAYVLRRVRIPAWRHPVRRPPGVGLASN